MSRRVLMLVMSDVAHDTRVLREAGALQDAGWSVEVIGRDVPPDWTPPPGLGVRSVPSSSVFRPTGKPAQAVAPSALPPHLRLARWALLPRHRASSQARWLNQARALASADSRYDVVHAHDFPVLGLADELARGWGARLVYDAHEYWRGRARHGRPTPLLTRAEARAENALLARADVVITVSAGIARRLHEHGAAAPLVVRNSFPALPSAAPVPAAPTGAVYAGRVAAARDLDTVIAAAPLLDGITLTLAGPTDPGWVAAHITGTSARIELLPNRPSDEVDALYRERGIALVTLEDSCRNHRLALPNKLFQAVRAGVPVVAADLPELREVVTTHRLGALYRPGDAASLAAAVREVRDEYAALCATVAAAAPALSWAVDAAVLRDAYEPLAR